MVVKTCLLETKKLKHVLRQYLLGQTREKESDIVENWYRSFDVTPLPQLSREEEEDIRQEIWDRIRPELRKRKIFFLRPVMTGVAAAVLLAATGLTWFMIQRSAAPACTVVSTSIGQRKTVNMKDGSRLVLNAGSTVCIPEDFSHERRIRIEDGEVFFDVKQNTEKPFIVESGPLTTTVLGTSFNVSAYKDVQRLHVGVVSGKVSVNASVLTKGQELVYDRVTKRGKINKLDESLLEWQKGTLVLNDASFDEMVILMQKNFGITITTSQLHVRETRYTTELSTVMDPVNAAEILAAIHHLKVKSTGRHVLLYE